MTTIRVLSYNIRSMRDDRGALARVIRACRADILCIQEAPRFLRWRGKRRWLARRSGLVIATGKRPAGLALYASPRAVLLHREYHLLSRVPGLHRRGLAAAVFTVDGVRFIAASTHLDLAEKPRRVHAGEILGLLDRARDRFGAPVVLAGDINEEPGGAAWTLLARDLRDAYAAMPRGQEHTIGDCGGERRIDSRRRIDAVFADRVIEVRGCGVPDDPALIDDYSLASDHRPVLAEFEIGR